MADDLSHFKQEGGGRQIDFEGGAGACGKTTHVAARLDVMWRSEYFIRPFAGVAREYCGGRGLEVRAKRNEGREIGVKPRMPKGDDQDFGHALGMGLQVVVGGTLGFFVGSWVDRKFHTGPWGMLIGILIGLAAGMYQLIREGIRINKD